ncbi:MAG: 50S ribosomal protein L9 [Chloroflexi bacterium]|jgi:large subunit ribosomal protein L9|nr:50S ribosomal protein L9 [Anaerolineaceae bacterium]NLI43820.1 50S ribosomal protein L9 [Chloroflexota bacterium]HOE35363.1 50S ribosomal protein L9 [Anaerolineaceae bacterium]HOT25935.1 50S ribosomal protein L9 [Anaerolineaceae bacterium]HQK03578.1 50S ribosomal protein L9 [Anaerolineaceae bacterium]
MKVLLIKDVYKLGRAGDIKKVADGYGRNYLIPQGLALPATESSIKLSETIGQKASEKRAILNNELQGLADILSGLRLEFAVKAGETGKLYGSVTSQMVAEKVKELKGVELDRHQIVLEPIRTLGEYEVPVHLTIDLIPQLQVIVRREGEATKVRPTKAAETAPEPAVETPAENAEESAEA